MGKETFLKKYNLTEDQFCGKEKIGGDLDLSSVTSLPDGFNPTVGGYIYLRSGRFHIGYFVTVAIAEKIKRLLSGSF